MKALIFLVFIALSLKGITQDDLTQRLTDADSLLIKKISIGKFCLCQTTLSDLKKLDNELKEVKVEEMDLCNDDFVQDSRFMNRVGYYSKNFPGIIFQKDRNDDFISKIRLTKEYIGTLPDGSPVNMGKLLAKDVLKLYPGYDSSWRSRDCSPYWNLTNDTLSFFVRIDTSKKPRYPIDEAYYLEKPIEGIDLAISCYGVFRRKQRFQKFLTDPVFFLDSVNVTRLEMQNLQPTDIARLTVYKDSNATRLVGPQGAEGVVYIETKTFARKRYWSFFKSRSAEYSKIVPDPAADQNICYILNGKVLKENLEAELSGVIGDSFIDLTVVGKDKLAKDFSVTDKKYGVLIRSKPKKNEQHVKTDKA